MRRIGFALVALAAGLAQGALACTAQLQAANVHALPTWSSAALAQGGRLQENVDLRIVAGPDCQLLLGVEIIGPEPDPGRVSVRTGPNGAEIGRAPGSGQPLLPVLLDPAAMALLIPSIEWSAEGRAVAAGIQTAHLRWLLYDAATLLSEPIATLDTRLLAEVPAMLGVTLSVAGARQALAAASVMLDFGELTEGAQRALEIEIEGNAPARISVSAEWGELRHATRSGYRIPYALRLDGRPLDAGSAPLAVGAGVARLQLSVEIGEVERRAAGTYEDVLTIVVAPE